MGACRRGGADRRRAGVGRAGRRCDGVGRPGRRRGILVGGPVRTCVGCRRRFSVAEDRLVRVVRTSEGSLAVGSTLPGRGAWLCGGSGDCLALALKRRALGRALRADLSAAALDALRDVLRDRFPAVTPPARD